MSWEVRDSRGEVIHSFATERAAQRCANITGGTVHRAGERPQRMSTRAKLECRCTVCKVTAPGELHTASLGPHGAEWIAPPAGWWVLLGTREPFLRCPDCLARPDGDPQGMTVT